MIDLFINPDLFRVINEYTDLRSLCDTCTFLSTLKTYITYKLTKEYSLLYYDDVLFRNRVLHKIFNPNKQLHLNLSYCDITDVSALGNVHTLNLCGCNITDVSALGNVHDLNLSWCDNITDVSSLGNVHTLNLSLCNITDVSALGNVT
jgi:Leucine-rich repeat (LRR) protein